MNAHQVALHKALGESWMNKVAAPARAKCRIVEPLSEPPLRELTS